MRHNTVGVQLNGIISYGESSQTLEVIVGMQPFGFARQAGATHHLSWQNNQQVCDFGTGLQQMSYKL